MLSIVIIFITTTITIHVAYFENCDFTERVWTKAPPGVFFSISSQ